MDEKLKVRAVEKLEQQGMLNLTLFAAYVGISYPTAKKYLGLKLIKTIHVGDRHYILKDTVVRFVKEKDDVKRRASEISGQTGSSTT